MKVSIGIKIRLGFSVAILILIAIAGTAAFARIDFLHRHFPLLSIACGVMGVLCLLAGTVVRRTLAAQIEDEEAAPGPALRDHPLAFLRSFKYWGLIMMVSAGMLYSLDASHIEPNKPAAHEVVV